MNKFFGSIKQFIDEVVVEIKKVSWPSRQELINSTVVVISVVIILSFYIGAVDYILVTLLNLFIAGK